MLYIDYTTLIFLSVVVILTAFLVGYCVRASKNLVDNAWKPTGINVGGRVPHGYTVPVGGYDVMYNVKTGQLKVNVDEYDIC